MVKKYFIIIVISFLLGSLCTGGIVFYFFTQSNKELARHRELVAERDDTISQLETNLNEANSTIRTLRESIDNIENGVVEIEGTNNNIRELSQRGLDIIRELEENQSEIRQRLRDITEEK